MRHIKRSDEDNGAWRCLWMQAMVAITSLNDNDVLLGRGHGAQNYRGNQRFQRLIKTRKVEYMSLRSSKEKRVISQSIYNEIERRGGRFLSLVDNGKQVKNIVEEGEWEEVSKKAGLDKVKRALSERKWKGTLQEDHNNDETPKGISESDDGRSETRSSLLHNALQKMPDNNASFDEESYHSLMERPVLPSMLVESERPCATPIHDGSGSIHASFPPKHQTSQEDCIPSREVTTTTANPYQGNTPPPNRLESLLTALGLGAWAALSDEEKEVVLTDLFGDKCSLDTHHRKRAQRDCDENTVSFLLMQMRQEIESMPEKKKVTLTVAAQGKCRKEEFGDSRLEDERKRQAEEALSRAYAGKEAKRRKSAEEEQSRRFVEQQAIEKHQRQEESQEAERAKRAADTAAKAAGRMEERRLRENTSDGVQKREAKKTGCQEKQWPPSPVEE